MKIIKKILIIFSLSCLFGAAITYSIDIWEKFWWNDKLIQTFSFFGVISITIIIIICGLENQKKESLIGENEESVEKTDNSKQ